MTVLNAAAAADALRQELGVEAVIDGGVLAVVLSPGQWLACGRLLRGRLGCGFFNFLTAIDWKEQGLEVVCRVDNLDAKLSVVMRTKLGAGVEHCPSLVGVWRGADWMERECYDMFGIRFDDHPDLRRILLADDWEGYPLRKDYAVDAPHAPYR